jgi:hypothetical protein
VEYKITLKADRWMYMFWGPITGWAPLLAAYGFIRDINRDPGGLIAAFGAPLLVLLFIGMYRIEIDDTKLSYRTLFGGNRTLPFDQILSIRAAQDYGPGESQFLPRYRLEIEPISRELYRPIVINLRIFTRDGCLLLIDKLSQARPDLEGNLPKRKKRHKA